MAKQENTYCSNSINNLNPQCEINRMDRKILSIAIVLIIILIIAVAGVMMRAGNKNEPAGSKKVLLQTTMGDITIELYDSMPITTGNFEKLVKQGFYDGVIFHRVIDGFMLQGGDPTGTGMK